MKMKYYIYENTPDFECTLMEKHGKFNMTCSHYHATYEILIMLDGTRYAFFNNGTHSLSAGDILIIKPYTLHLTENRESDYFKRYALNFSDSVLKIILSDEESKKLLNSIYTGIIHANTADFHTILRLIENISEADQEKGKFSRKKLASNMLVFIDMLSKMPTNEQSKDKGDIICSDSLANALNYINRNFTKELTLDFIVDYAHISKANFCRIFKKETGSTFLQYLNNLRVAYAHSLLIETDLSIQRIADKAGFSSVLHFDRVFKSIHGITPSAMRKQAVFSANTTK